MNSIKRSNFKIIFYKKIIYEFYKQYTNSLFQSQIQLQTQIQLYPDSQQEEVQNTRGGIRKTKTKTNKNNETRY